MLYAKVAHVWLIAKALLPIMLIIVPKRTINRNPLHIINSSRRHGRRGSKRAKRNNSKNESVSLHIVPHQPTDQKK
jgi:hypothetical protein